MPKLKVDKPWEEGTVRLIKKAKVAVIPIYFHAKKTLVSITLERNYACNVALS